MKITTIQDRALIRLISETHHKPPVLRGLVDSDAEAAILADIEGETSARLIAEREGAREIDRRELAFRRRAHDLAVYGQSHVNAAFAYTRPTGNRFNTGGRGAWYCAYEPLTAIDEVAYHRTRELAYVGVFDGAALYVEILADFIGDFPDIGDAADNLALDADPAVGYPAGQALAAALRREGHTGLLYPSVRRRGGRCFVAFDPGIVQNVRLGAKWRIVWRGTRDYDVEAA